jgi:hypothetical protein
MRVVERWRAWKVFFAPLMAAAICGSWGAASADVLIVEKGAPRAAIVKPVQDRSAL